MSISVNQKKIINIVKKDIKAIEDSGNDVGTSSLAYFALWGRTPGFKKLYFKLRGGLSIFSFAKIVLKDIISISAHSNYIAHKQGEKNKSDYDNLIVSWASEQDFNEDGSYIDRYFKISSKNFANYLFFLIYNEDELPNKIDENIILLKRIEYKYKYNLIFLIKYILKKIIFSKFSLIKFFHATSTYTRTAEVTLDLLKKEIDLKNIRSIIMPYEGQPFQQTIFFEAKKFNKNIITTGYDHSAPQSIPVHLFFRKGAPDLLLVNGPSQVRYFVDNLNWSPEKIKIVPSIRYQKNENLNFSNLIFLPYEIFDEKIILKEFENFLKISYQESLNKLVVKNHPMMLNSDSHIRIKLQLENIMENYKNRFSEKPLDSNLSVFIGPTTGAIVALEKDLKVFHVCFDSVLESYSEKLWPMLDVNQLNTNMFEYKLKKKGEFILFGEEKNIFEKYYSY